MIIEVADNFHKLWGLIAEGNVIKIIFAIQGILLSTGEVNA